MTSWPLSDNICFYSTYATIPLPAAYHSFGWTGVGTIHNSFIIWVGMGYLPNKAPWRFGFLLRLGLLAWYDLEPTRKQASNARSGSLLCMHIYLPIGCVNTLR
jgi:hypothetical protein